MEILTDYNDEYTLDDALWDTYYEQLEYYWYDCRPKHIEKDFEELSYHEVEQLKRDYKTYLEQDEANYNPERFYMTGGI